MKVVNLKPLFVMNNQYFVKNFLECFNNLNRLLKSKSGVDYDPLFVKEENGKIRLGYKPISQKGTHFYSDETIPSDFGALDRACMVQFVIFEACKEYDCFEEVPMCGAPEEGGDSFFKFTFEGNEYQYSIWSD